MSSLVDIAERVLKSNELPWRTKELMAETKK